MRGHALSDGQIRGRLAHVSEAFLAHGKQMDMEKVRAFALKRLEQGRPFLGEMFEHFEDRDYESLIRIITHDLASHEKGEADRKEALKSKGSKVKSKRKAKSKSKPKEKLSDVQVDVEDDKEIDPLDV